MECCDVRERLSCYVDRALDERTLELVESHLALCADCRAEAAVLGSLICVCAEMEQAEPPVALRGRILSAVHAEADGSDCERITRLLSAYTDGETEYAQRDAISAHLAACPDCASEARALQLVVSAASEIEPVEPPVGLRTRIADATTERAPGKRVAGSSLADWLRLTLVPGAGRWAGAAAAAGIIAATVVLWTPRPKEVARSIPVASKAQSAASALERPEPPKPIIAADSRVAQPSAIRTVVRRPQPGSSPRMPIVVLPPATAEPEPAESAATPTTVLTEAPAEAEGPVVELVAEDPGENESPAVEPTPEPAPELASSRLAEQPTLIKVASAPPTERDSTEEWLKQVKANAAMRGSRTSGGVNILNAKF